MLIGNNVIEDYIITGLIIIQFVYFIRLIVVIIQIFRDCFRPYDHT